MFNIYIKQAAEVYGVTHTRAIYEKAIEILPNNEAREMCLRFADLEKKLGEIDRARAIYGHGSQISDPRVAPQFWESWKEFEINHGNEDTVREMLRIKRSVQATYNTQVNFMSAQMLAAQNKKQEGNAEPEDEMQQLEARARQMAQESLQEKAQANKKLLFVRSSTTTEELGEMTKTNNPEEIDIGDEEDETDEEEDVEEIEVQTQSIPSEVFGKLAAQTSGGGEED